MRALRTTSFQYDGGAIGSEIRALAGTPAAAVGIWTRTPAGSRATATLRRSHGYPLMNHDESVGPLGGAVAAPTRVMLWRRGDLEISTDPGRLDLECVHDFLSRHSYWARNIPREVVKRAIRNSIVFGLYACGAQIGFARVVTDRATFAYLADVFVLKEHRGQGHAAWMMQAVVAHPDLQGLRRWLLATRDAHGLYEQIGFTPLASPCQFMERFDGGVYSANEAVVPRG